jgi:hypothetical protein
MIKWEKLPNTNDIRWLGGEITHEKRFARIDGKTFYREILKNEKGGETCYYDDERKHYKLEEIENLLKAK